MALTEILTGHFSRIKALHMLRKMDVPTVTSPTGLCPVPKPRDAVFTVTIVMFCNQTSFLTNDQIYMMDFMFQYKLK